MTKKKFSLKVPANIKRVLRARNAAFKKLTRPEQRVQIAKDVLAALATRRFVATSTYFDLPNEVQEICNSDDGQTAKLDVSEVTSQVKCDVCGIGSLFVAAVERADKLKINDFMNEDTRDAEVNYLKRWFSDEMLDKVEDYFEVGNGNLSSASPIQRQEKRSKRMKMIMENIISNNGKFDPEKGSHKNDDRRVPGSEICSCGCGQRV